MTPFCQHHLLRFFDQFDAKDLHFDLALHLYFKEHHALGSKDRRSISDWAVALIRWKRLLDYKIEGTPTWEKRLSCWLSLDLEKTLKDESIPINIRASMPDYLFQRLVEVYGEEEAFRLALVSNERAPVTVRTNLLKTTRESLLIRLLKQFDVAPTEQSKAGITFAKNALFRDIPEFKEGFFEVQDEGSQLLADQVEIMPGQLFVDFCAGSGGKTLAVAAHMHNKGQIFYHDIRPKALAEAKLRLRRAGVQNAQQLYEDTPQWKKLKRKVDWVLVDAPCSGTGTLRRNLDLKWRIDQDLIQEMRGKQRHIFERALQFVKPGGHIVYATCSILPEENDEQVAHFLATYPVTLSHPPFRTLPQSGHMDGFFSATFLLA